jgi:hypothetical protein
MTTAIELHAERVSDAALELAEQLLGDNRYEEALQALGCVYLTVGPAERAVRCDAEARLGLHLVEDGVA